MCRCGGRFVASRSDAFLFRRAHALTERDSIVLTDFINTTGDQIFDRTLKQALEDDLGQSPYLHVLPEQKVRATLRLMGRSQDERLTTEVARDLAERTGSKDCARRGYRATGKPYVITLNAINAVSGDTIAQDQEQAESGKSIDRARLGRVAFAEQVRRIAGFRPQAGQTPGGGHHFIAGGPESIFRRRGNSRQERRRRSGLFYQHAVELDPNFALAYARLGTVYGNSGDRGHAIEYHTDYELRERVTDRERFYITAHYYEALGDIPKEDETYELWLKSYPTDSIPQLNVGIDYAELGQFDKALAASRKALELDPSSQLNYVNTAAYFMVNGRLDEAKQILRRAFDAGMDSVSLRFMQSVIAFREGDGRRSSETWNGRKEERVRDSYLSAAQPWQPTMASCARPKDSFSRRWRKPRVGAAQSAQPTTWPARPTGKPWSVI